MLDQSSEGRQRIQKKLAVSAGDNAAVQYGDPTGVLFRSQQTANGLNQLNGCIRYGDFHERIASALGNPLRQAGFNRIIRNREWQSGDHHVVQDRKSTRLNSSHVRISYAVFCLKKKK